MLWFEPFPYWRWAMAILIALGALYVEFRPDPNVGQPFAVVDIAPGDEIATANTEIRQVPVGLMEAASLGDVATRPIVVGDPVLRSDVAESGRAVPPGWWVVGVSLPEGAVPGDAVRLVLLDSGLEIEGVVASQGSDDPFGAADGGVAVPSAHSAEVARAAANGRLTVLISTG